MSAPARSTSPHRPTCPRCHRQLSRGERGLECRTDWCGITVQLETEPATTGAVRMVRQTPSRGERILSGAMVGAVVGAAGWAVGGWQLVPIPFPVGSGPAFWVPILVCMVVGMILGVIRH